MIGRQVRERSTTLAQDNFGTQFDACQPEVARWVRMFIGWFLKALLGLVSIRKDQSMRHIQMTEEEKSERRCFTYLGALHLRATLAYETRRTTRTLLCSADFLDDPLRLNKSYYSNPTQRMLSHSHANARPTDKLQSQPCSSGRMVLLELSSMASYMPVSPC